MILSRRSFLHASLMAGGLVVVPRFERWFRPPDTRLFLYEDGVHDDWPALQALANGHHILRGREVVRGRGDWIVANRSLLISRTLHLPFAHGGNAGALVGNMFVWSNPTPPRGAMIEMRGGFNVRPDIAGIQWGAL